MRTAAVVAAALLVGPQIASKATRDALFLSSFDVSALPYMTAGAAVASLLATLAFSRALSRVAPARLLPGVLAASALLFLLEALLAPAEPRAAAVLLYLHYATLGAVVLSSFWSLVTERFDPHAAKLSMGAIGSGASLGGVAGGLAAWAAAGRVSIPSLLLALAAASILGLVSVVRLTRGSVDVTREPEDDLPAPSGVRLVLEVPYLRNLALLVLLGASLDTLLDYVLGASASAAFGRGAPLLSFFALFHAGTALLALLVQATLTQRLLQGPGIAATLGLQPAYALAGAVASFVSPRLGTELALRGGHSVLRNSAFRAAYELLYTPLPPEQKRPAKVVVDVACDRLGALLGSGAVVACLALAAPGAAPRVVLGLAAILAALALALTPRFRTDYVTALGDSLRSGGPTLEPGATIEAGTLLTLASLRFAPESMGPRTDPLAAAIAALGSGDAAQVHAVLDRSWLDPRLVPHVLPLLADDALAPGAIRCLRLVAARETAALAAALVDPLLDPAARRRIPRVLKTVTTQDAADALLRALADARFDIRYRCGQALRHMREEGPWIDFPADRVHQAAAREGAALGSAEGRLDHVFNLLSLVGDPEELDLARRALQGADVHLRGTALEYLDNVLPAPVREPLFAHVAGARPAVSRPAAEIRDELLRSAQALPRPAPSDDPDY